MSKLQEKPLALRREHSALPKMKFMNFFVFLWVIFALLDPGPICGGNIKKFSFYKKMFKW
jgi:hypothetical protein